MTTKVNTSTTATITASNAERIGKAVADVAKRIRIQDFEVVSIKGDVFSDRDNKVTVDLHADTRRDFNKIVAYFQLSDVRDIAGGIVVAGPAAVTGLPGILVEVYATASDDEAGAR